jgi:hypothetical protein
MARETKSEYHFRRAREERDEASRHMGEPAERRHALLAVGHEALAKKFAAEMPAAPASLIRNEMVSKRQDGGNLPPDGLNDPGNFD